MDGRKGTVEYEIMKGLRKAMKEEFGRDSKSLGVSLVSYDRMWNATYNFLSQMCETKPAHRLVRDSVGMVGNFARLVELCRLHLREDYTDERIETACLINSEGLETTTMKILPKEAAWPLSQSIFHPLRALLLCIHAVARKQYIRETRIVYGYCHEHSNR